MRHCRVTFKIVTRPIKLLEINMRYNNSYCCFRSQIKLTYMSSWKSSKEGDFPLCALCQRGSFYVKPFCDINFVYQHSNSGWIFEYDEIFLPYNGLKLFIWCITFNHCSWWILCWLSNAFSLQNSIQFILFEEKMIGRKWGSKRGRFPFLGGRCMFRREMESKRGSLLLKRETCVCLQCSFKGGWLTDIIIYSNNYDLLLFPLFNRHERCFISR